MSAFWGKADIIQTSPNRDTGAAPGRSDSGGREAGIKLVAHLCCLGSKRYAPQQLICLSSRNSAVEAEGFSSTLPRPSWHCKMHRYNSNQFSVFCDEWRTLDRAETGFFH